MASPDATSATIRDLLRSRVEASPDSAAYWYQSDSDWQSTTWKQFHAKVLALAAGLVSRGLIPGTHVGLLASTGINWEIAHHAVLNAGGVVVGLESHDIAERLHWIISHAEVAILIVESRALLAKVASHAPLDLRMVVFFEEDAAQSAGNEVTLSALLGQPAIPYSLPVIRPEAAATIIYTSGTTGQPKGILYRHEQVVLAIRAITAAYPSIDVGSRFVCWLPLSNLFQRIMNLAAMQVGGTVYLVRNPLDVLKALPVAQPDIFIGVPRFYEKLHEGIQNEIDRKSPLLRNAIWRSIDLALEVSKAMRAGEKVPAVKRWLLRLANHFILSKLRSVMGGRVQFMITGSAPTPIRLLEFFHAIGLPLYEAYGMSENVVPMALNRPDAYRFGTVGRPIDVNELRTDADGELLVRGPGVFSGYFKDNWPDLFTDDKFYRTGDYGLVDESGYLSLRGRKSEIIKTSTGRRISPRPIEEVLEAIEGVERAIAIGNGRKCLSAVVSLHSTLRPDCYLRSIEVWKKRIKRASQLLPAHERPAGVLLVSFSFTIENGGLTSNFKLRRGPIENRLLADLDALYQRIETTAVDCLPIMVLAAGYQDT